MTAGKFHEKILILVYNTMWNECFEHTPKDVPDNFVITHDRKLFPFADAVLFHMPTLHKELGPSMELEKREGQLWIAWSMESEINYPWTKRPEISGMFDLWMGYHKHDDIIHSYYDFEYLSALYRPTSISSKTNKTCMFISSPFNKSNRFEYLKELMQFTEIDSYGHIFNNKQISHYKGRDTKNEIISQYKFTIAFENAISKDYVSEKFFDPLLNSSVPIYLGAPNIIDFIPGKNCFIDVRQFENPKSLAQFINSCCENDLLYEQFFKWKKQPPLSSFKTKVQPLQVPLATRLCMKVREKREEEACMQSKIKNLGNIYLCSFGDSRFSKSRERLITQAMLLGLFEDIFVFNESELEDSFKNRFSQMKLGSKGYGYWAWKPYIILKCLDRIRENDVLLYLDMGCHINPRGKKQFTDYWEKVRFNTSGFLVSELDNNFSERKWTKGDLFDFFNARNNIDIIETPQYQGGILFIRKNQQTIRLIEEWMNIYYSNFHLVDDTPSKSSDFNDFIEHRHDQSILSILLKINGTSKIPVSETHNMDWTILEKQFPILTKRDLQ